MQCFLGILSKNLHNISYNIYIYILTVNKFVFYVESVQHNTATITKSVQILNHSCKPLGISRTNQSRPFVKLIQIKSPTFWDITPYSLVKVNLSFRGTYCIRLQVQRISHARNQHEADSKHSKVEAIYSSEMSVDFQQTTRRYISDDTTLHSHLCENLKSTSFT
jgi:hypothetical protein